MTSRSAQIWRSALFVLALAGAVVLTYRPVWHAGFIWDDDIHLLSNPVLQGGGLATTWKPGGYLNYWPVTFTTYWLGFHAWGLHALGFHLLNVALHILAALLVWRLLLRLGLAAPAAMLAAAIFALHPVGAETVAWVAQLKGILSLLLALGAAMFYLDFEDRGHWWHYALALLLFVASALSKGALLTLPLVLLMCAWWRRHRITWRDVSCILPLLLIGAGCVALELRAQQDVAVHDVVRSAGFFTRLAEAGYVVWFYLWKLVWPVHLSVMYAPDWAVNPGHLRCWLPDLLIGAILLSAWLARRTWGRPVVVLIACYLLLLAPVLGFVDVYAMLYSLVADHYQYAAMVVPIAGAGALLSAIAKPISRPPVRAALFGIPAAGLLTLLAILSFVRAGVYGNDLLLWQDAVAENPRCAVAQNNLGVALAAAKRVDDAIDHYQVALKISPDYAAADTNLGNALLDQGQVGDAIAQYHRALKADPAYFRADYDLGNALVRSGHPQEAIAAYQKALAIYPDFPEADNNLGIALLGAGQLGDAITYFRKALQLRPDYADARRNLEAAQAQRE